MMTEVMFGKIFLSAISPWTDGTLEFGGEIRAVNTELMIQEALFGG